jgi:Sensors of blue-light using FAD
MLQLIYVSTIRPGVEVSLAQILHVSRLNNRRDGITGLLHANSRRFMQALEGEEGLVDAAMARIERDHRHFALVVLSRRPIEIREFGDWSMAHDDGTDHDGVVQRICQLVENAAPGVRGTFEGFVGIPNPLAA